MGEERSCFKLFWEKCLIEFVGRLEIRRVTYNFEFRGLRVFVGICFVCGLGLSGWCCVAVDEN